MAGEQRSGTGREDIEIGVRQFLVQKLRLPAALASRVFLRTRSAKNNSDGWDHGHAPVLLPGSRYPNRYNDDMVLLEFGRTYRAPRR